ncbi:MAG: dCTP deaminase [Candidatus Asgardarchaeia archaeon]
MFLGRDDIFMALKKGDIQIEPFNEDMVGPDSVDVHLGDKLLIVENNGEIIDPEDLSNQRVRVHDLNERPYLLKRDDFILGHTMEKIGLSNKIFALIEGRSSLGRLGVVVHMTAGIIHAGWGYDNPNALTLEISSVNPNPILIKKRMGIGQLVFAELKNETSIGYSQIPRSKYVNQKTVLPSKMNED